MSSLLLSPFSRIVDSFDYSTVSGKLLVASLCAAGMWLTSLPPAHARRRRGIWPRRRNLPSVLPYDPDSSSFAREQSRLFADIVAKTAKGSKNRRGRIHPILKASGSFESWVGRSKAKAVNFAWQIRKETRVSRWIIPELHKHKHMRTKSEDYELECAEEDVTPFPEPFVPTGHVQWDFNGEMLRYPAIEEEPEYQNKISFPRTSWPRDVSNIRAEDDDGDTSMSDAPILPPSTSLDLLVDSFALLSLG